MSSAADHARLASRLLDSIAARERELDELTPEQMLELSIGGAIARHNADTAHTVNLAQAHALTAIALRAIEP